MGCNLTSHGMLLDLVGAHNLQLLGQLANSPVNEPMSLAIPKAKHIKLIPLINPIHHPSHPIHRQYPMVGEPLLYYSPKFYHPTLS